MTADPSAVDGKKETERFAAFGFDRFNELAQDATLSEHEKIGFPDALREGFGEAIWNDILGKLPAFRQPGAILDIGPGCGELPRRLITQAERLGQQVVLVDHKAMLDHLPASSAVRRVEGRFPDDVAKITALAPEGFDAILVYSVLQIVIVDSNPFAFVDAALALLKPGGQLLLGDIPNVSMLRRFLASQAGAEYHRAYMRTDDPPQVEAFARPGDRIDDGLALGLLMRARMAGFHAYLLPQASTLPFANRREDLLIVRP
ncbi:hypothetical protein BH11PSE1_BH11PSE1_07980 [soil metagenome]